MSETINKMPKATHPGPIPDSEWDFRSTGELVAALQARKVGSIELLEHTIARIEALDQRFNAVVVRDFDRARDAAKAADAALARGVRTPLLGIPITLKEAFNIAGLPTSWGYPQFCDFVPEEDALIVSRLKEAGAIIVGKTNLPVGLGDFQSYNEIYGTTNNPWDVRVDQQQHSRPALGRFRSDRILGDPCACPRISAASMRTSRHSIWSRFADIIRHLPDHYPEAATSASQARWRDAPRIFCLRLASPLDRTRRVRALATGSNYLPRGTAICRSFVFS
jgi:Amidase